MADNGLYRSHSSPRVQVTSYGFDGLPPNGNNNNSHLSPPPNPSASGSQRGSNGLLNRLTSSKGKNKVADSMHVVVGVGGDDRNFWRNEETLEKPPIVDHYRRSIDLGGNKARPTMLELMVGRPGETPMTHDKSAFHDSQDDIIKRQTSDGDSYDEGKETDQSNNEDKKIKFGWIQGVYVRCFLNILGVMLFLRISWVGGQAGLWYGSAIVLLSSVVTTLTALSMCAICTNGIVKGGGTYFLVSRSLGPEFGGSIGVLFSFANAVGAAMHIVGLAESVTHLMKDNHVAIIDNGVNDVRVIGLAVCCLLMAVVFIGTSFESKIQGILLLILVISLLNFIVGTFLPLSEVQVARGITGYSIDTLQENLLPVWREGHSFFSVFSIFFPAATGIMAGANISGDLKNPSTAIPKGTLLAILTTTLIYLLSLWVTGATCVRDAHGITQDILDAANHSGIDYAIINCTADWDTGDCEYGLMNFFRVMEEESVFAPLIQAGIFAATLSSALASLVSAPKIFQAVCKDELLPYIHVFGKGYGTQEEPRRAYLLCFVITLGVICIGELNVIAPIISNFFLCTYALINFACFHASFARSPGWRPTFKYYNQWVSLLGAALCLIVMFIMSWWTALITLIVFAAVFIYINHRKPEANWGSSIEANSYRSTLGALIKLTTSEEHVKNYRPQILVLTGNPAARTPLVDFAYNITKGRSLMICGHVVPYDVSERVFFCLSKLEKQFTKWLENRKVKSFYNPVANTSLRSGTDTLLQTAGLGRLKPNILMLGFKANWNVNKANGLDDINDYFNVIRDAFDSNVGVAVLRNGNGEGLDYSELMKENNLGYPTMAGLLELLESHAPLGQGLFSASVDNLNGATPVSSPNWSSTALNELDGSTHRTAGVYDFNTNGGRKALSPEAINSISSTVPHRRMTVGQREVTTTMDRFRTKVKNAVIDVWWLYDDGGLTLFVPHLLTLEKSYLEGAKIRVFTIASSHSTMEQERINMVALLSKFRIQFMEVFVIPDMSKKPSDALIREFEEVVAPFRATATDTREGLISDFEYTAQKSRTDRHLRLRELMLQNSSSAALVVVTMVVPRKDRVSSCLYMAWLDMLTRGMPPTLLIRGNQTNVLTFYS